MQEGANIARFGELSSFIIYVVFTVVFLAIGIIIVVDRISYVRLIVFSLVVWSMQVVLIYVLFSVNVHRRASDQVHSLYMYIMYMYTCTFYHVLYMCMYMYMYIDHTLLSSFLSLPLSPYIHM